MAMPDHDQGHQRASRFPTISKNRFEAFSDGVFAIAITLLVLELRPPDTAGAGGDVRASLLALWPQYLVYFASFATIGIMWFNHYALFHDARSISYTALIANLGLLLLVCFVPYSTLLMARLGIIPATTVFYGLIFLGLSICFNILWYAAHVPPGRRGSVGDFLRHRNMWNSIGLIVYGGGAIVAQWSPMTAIGMFTAIALYYMSPQSVRAALQASDGSEP